MRNKMNAFIFHGTAGYPEENWFPWLKQELEKIGCTTIVPQFPTPQNQTLENWFTIFSQYERHFNENTILIGHSLGGVFLLRVLEKYHHKIKAALLVGTPIGILPIKNYEGDKLFLAKPFNWEKIRKSCDTFFVYHSNNDPYVCVENGEELAKQLHTKLTFVENAGHFNKAAGYLKFEDLLRKIKSLQ